MTSDSARDARFTAFAEAIAVYFDLDEIEIIQDARLAEELGFDSIMFYECYLMLEDVAGHELDPLVIESMRSVGDLFNLYDQFDLSARPSGA